jgi:hypothetical protein
MRAGLVVGYAADITAWLLPACAHRKILRPMTRGVHSEAAGIGGVAPRILGRRRHGTKERKEPNFCQDDDALKLTLLSLRVVLLTVAMAVS